MKKCYEVPSLIPFVSETCLLKLSTQFQYSFKIKTKTRVSCKKGKYYLEELGASENTRRMKIIPTNPSERKIYALVLS